MATKIPRSIRRTLKRSLSEDVGHDPNKKEAQASALKNVKRDIRVQRNSGDIKRTKISWNVAPGDLVTIKGRRSRELVTQSSSSNKDTKQLTMGIVLYKESRVNYNGVEEDYIVVMTPQEASLRLSPKSIEKIQEVICE